MNRKIFNRIMMLIIVLATSAVSAQQTVTGTVSDPNGPLPGATVVVKGTSSGTTTDFDGNYTLEDVASDAILVFSFVGFATQEIAVNGQSTINVTLQEDTANLDEIVISAGYGRKFKRIDAVAAISTIDPNELKTVAVASNPVSALQGKVAGVQVENFGGQPGARANVFIRGVNSLSNADPLFIIDGLYVDNMQYINPNDIKNISVLKDAAAAAIYGTRAANGVILIETHHGSQSGKVEVKVNLKTGFDTPSKKLDLLNGEQYTEYLNQRFENDGDPSRAIWNGVDVDWQDENLSSALVQDYGFSISGGSSYGEDRGSSHFVSANYFKQDGILVGSGFERINVRVNNKFDFGRFHIKQSLGLAQGQLQQNNWYGFDGFTAPTVPLRNPANEGGFQAPVINDLVQGPGGANQFARASIEENLTTTRTLFGSANFTYDITDALKASVNFGVDYTNIKYFQFTPTFNFSPDSDSELNSKATNEVTDVRQTDLNLLVEPTLTYSKKFGDKHDLTVIAGYTYFSETEDRGGAFARGTDSNDIKTIGSAPVNTVTQLLGFNNRAGLESFFGRLDYGYDSKYLLSATLRRDASSRFAPDNRKGYFPSISGAWNISEESFWGEDNVVNYFKIRASYGELGSYPNVFYPTQATFISNVSNTFFGGVQANGLSLLTLADQGLVWETTKTFNVGLDLSFMNNSLNFTADYFEKDIEDVLVSISVPSTSGVNQSVQRNAGNLINKGLELVLDYSNKNSDSEFQYRVGTNFSFNIKSEAGDIPNPIVGPTVDEDRNRVNRTISGEPIGAFFGYLVEDKVDPATGNLVRIDTNGDGTVDNNDQTVIGDPIPDFTYGLNINAEYKGFDLALNFAGVQGNDIYNVNRYNLLLWQDGNKLTEVLGAWTPTNTDTNIPRATTASGGDKLPSSFFVEDGSYLRLKTLELGYNFKNGIFGTDLIKDLRLSLNIQNVFVITDYKGYDPDVSSTDGGRATLSTGVPGLRTPLNPLLGRGIDSRAYPNARTFMFGVQATF